LTNEEYKKLKTSHRVQIAWTESLRGYVTGVETTKDGKRWLWVSTERNAPREQSKKFEAREVRLTEHAANDGEARKHLIEQINANRVEIKNTRNTINGANDDLERKKARLQELVDRDRKLNEELNESNQ
jgi:chromosome segregation ATPase